MMKCQIYSHAVMQHTLSFSHIPDAISLISPVVRLCSPPVNNRSVRAACVQNLPISKRTQLHGCKCIVLPFSSELSPAPSSAFTSEVSPVPSSTLTSSTTTGDPHYLYIILNPLNSLPVFLTVLMPHKVHTYTVRSCTAGLCSVCHVSSKLFQYE